jgi:hypothetical protein
MVSVWVNTEIGSVAATVVRDMTHCEWAQCSTPNVGERLLECQYASGPYKGQYSTVATRHISAYPCTTCITDHMEASGPQSRQDLRRECRIQAMPYDNLIFTAAVDKLLAEGRIVIDDDMTDEHDTYFDFPESYYKSLP